jgi:hypothetical protein
VITSNWQPPPLPAHTRITVVDGVTTHVQQLGHVSLYTAEAHGCQIRWQSEVELTARGVNGVDRFGVDRYGVELVDPDGQVVAWSHQFRSNPGAWASTEDVEAERYAQDRAEAIDAAHRAMLSSYIGKPPPILRGDAERMVDALIARGRGPPPDESDPAEWDDWSE